jgi:nitrate/nitrite-specific signal transduction histidine kinase
MTLARTLARVWLCAAVAAVVLEGLRSFAVPRFLPAVTPAAGAAAFLGLTLAGIAAAAAFVRARLLVTHQRNRELLALLEASQELQHNPLALEDVLQRVVDHACKLLGARYGAVSVIDEGNRIHQFVTSGISAEQRARIGPPPRGHGLLGVPLREGQRLRLADLDRDPRSTGFPPHHPPMRSLLAVPIVCNGPFRGNLYLAEKPRGEFSSADEQTLARFATAAAVAIDNAYLHERASALAVGEERVRIAREMHDGMAQVLAYVNAKVQAVKEFVTRERHEEACAQLDDLAAAARTTYADLRETILALRTDGAPVLSLAETLASYLDQWQLQSQIKTSLTVPSALPMAPTSELQLLRILQEALANVRKHSGASLVVVEIRLGDGCVEARVEDDGVGFDPEGAPRGRFPRFGLAIMRERAESVGGELQVASRPGAGTRVLVRVPTKETALAQSQWKRDPPA